MIKYFSSFIPYFAGPVLGLVFILMLPAGAVTQVIPLEKTPPVVLPLLDPNENRVALDRFLGKTNILVFGEIYNDNTRKALGELDQLIRVLNAAAGFEPNELAVYFIHSQVISPQQRKEHLSNLSSPVVMLHDTTRAAFGGYGVLVLPTFFILDPQGNINTRISGFPLAFADMINDAILFSTGKINRLQYETASQDIALQTDQLKAERLAGLARQLFRRGLHELALERYEKALQLDENSLLAKIGIARCFIKLNLLEQADQMLQNVLDSDKNNVEANLALAWIEIIRGAKHDLAHERLERLLQHSPNNPEALYLMGMIFEARDENDKALARYKQAAEILLEIKGK
jgi:tetratricopeptide (TPR) repeat protein